MQKEKGVGERTPENRCSFNGAHLFLCLVVNFLLVFLWGISLRWETLPFYFFFYRKTLFFWGNLFFLYFPEQVSLRDSALGDACVQVSHFTHASPTHLHLGEIKVNMPTHLAKRTLTYKELVGNHNLLYSLKLLKLNHLMEYFCDSKRYRKLRLGRLAWAENPLEMPLDSIAFKPQNLHGGLRDTALK